ncbi:MAG: serine hydrolase, partial [Candidatus Velthaea sp.]
LAVATAAAVDAGRLRWHDRIAVDAANMTANDAPSPLVAGYAASVEELLEFMLARSDNVATNVLIDAVGRAEATRTLAGLGFTATAIRRKLSGALPLIDDPAATGRNQHSSTDAAELLRRVALRDVPGAARIHRALAAQFWNGKLSTGLMPGDRFAHKTGDTDEWSHDGGILTLPNDARYVVVVYTNLPSGGENDRRFGAFMRALRAHLADG